LSAFYERDGDTFVPSELTRGPWDPGAQHAGPPSALLGRAVEAGGTLIGRITIEVLRPVPLAPLTVASRVVRPGRNVELLEATMAEPGEDARPIARAVAWRLRIDDSVAALDSGPPPPGPDAGAERPFFPTGEDVGYHTATSGSSSTRSPTSARTASGCRRASCTTRPAGWAAPPRRCSSAGAE